MGEARRRRDRGEVAEQFEPGLITYQTPTGPVVFEITRRGRVYRRKLSQARFPAQPADAAAVREAARNHRDEERAKKAGLVLPDKPGIVTSKGGGR